jgi:hypothetical protein
MDNIAMLCRAMWLTVINTALDDYRRKKLGRDYFSSPYFCHVVCKMADVMPEDVRKVL